MNNMIHNEIKGFTYWTNKTGSARRMFGACWWFGFLMFVDRVLMLVCLVCGVESTLNGGDNARCLSSSSLILVYTCPIMFNVDRKIKRRHAR